MICKILILIPYLIIIPNEINILTLIDKIFDIIIPADPNYTKIINDKLKIFYNNFYLYIIVYAINKYLYHHISLIAIVELT